MGRKLELVVAGNQTPPIPDLAASEAPRAAGMSGTIWRGWWGGSRDRGLGIRNHRAELRWPG
jgi:hypothetical protein